MFARLKSAWSRYIPHRRRRFWRYVSPRRRGLGVVLLAVLVAMSYVFWYFTNDNRIRTEAEKYLQTLTGGRVRIKHAHFSLFSGIELKDVRLIVPGEAVPEPLFSASSVVLHYRLFDSLMHRRLEAGEILCTEPTIVLVHHVEEDTYNAKDLLSRASPGGEGRLAWVHDLPAIQVRKAKVRVYEVGADGKAQRRGEKKLSLTFVPDANGTYRIGMEEERGGGKTSFQGTIVYNVAAGTFDIQTRTVLEGIDEVLPLKYTQWRERYKVRGEVLLSARSEAAAGRPALQADLQGVSLRLSDEEGGLELTGATGRVLFEPNCISLKDVSAHLRQAGDANVTVNGQYDGYSPASPFDMHLAIAHMTLPDSNSVGGPLKDICRRAHEDFSPTGPLSVELQAQRLAGGQIRCQGQVALEGMSMSYRWAPYLMEDLRGRAHFDSNRVTIDEFLGRHGGESLRITGFLTELFAQGEMDLHIDANDMPLDADLEKTLPPNILGGYRDLSPMGLVGLNLRIHRKAGEKVEHVDPIATFDGRASMSYARFPYRIEKISGRVSVSDDQAVLADMRGTRGGMSCRLDGKITHLSSDKNGVELTILADRLPLDQTLMNALPPENLAMMKSVNPAGFADGVRVTLHQAEGKEMEYAIQAAIRQGSFKVDAMPYPVTDANGALTVTNEKVTFQDIRGRHDKTAVSIPRGEVCMGKTHGVDIDLRCEGLRLDQELYDTLPKDIQPVWQRLKPLGLADLSLTYAADTPDLPGKSTYRLVLTARDVQVMCRDFPLRLAGVRGRAVATPGLVELQDVTASDGNMTVKLNGRLAFDRGSTKLDLTAEANNVPISAEFLDAIPGEMVQVAARFQKGGWCDLNLRKLQMTLADSPGAATQPAATAQPATAASAATQLAQSAPATTQPARTMWDIEGSFSCREAVVDMGFGPRTVTGTLAGKASRSADGIAVDARMDVDDFHLGRQRITDLHAKLVKSAKAESLHLDEMEGKAYGGRLAGKARIELGDPPRASASFSIEDVGLRSLIRDALADANAAQEIDGLLSGDVQFTNAGNRTEDRQAAGKLRVSKGSLYRLPVMLGLFQIITLQLPSQAAFTEGEFDYHLRGDKLTFQEIYLRGAGISLLGSGRVNLKNETLNLTFLAGADLPRLSGLSDLVNLVKEINEIQVTGTLKRPITRSVPLRSLDEAIRRLVSPGGEKD